MHNSVKKTSKPKNFSDALNESKKTLSTKERINTSPCTFMIWSDEIEGRFDPYFFYSITTCENFINPTPIDAIANVQGGYAFKSNEYKQNGIPLVRIQNLFDNTVNTADTVYIDEKYKERLAQFLLNEDDILIAMTGATIGKTGRIDKQSLPAFLNQRVGRFKVNTAKVNADYFYHILQLSLFQKQLKRLALGGAQPNISPKSIEQIKIPLPSLNTQNKIVEIMQKAYEEKRRKEEEARRLLDSIDEYVLGELGIELPESRQEIRFTVWSDEVDHNRIDPYYYLPRFRALEKITQSKQFKPLKDLIQRITKGETPLWRGDTYVVTGIPFLKVQNITPNGISDELTYISHKVHQRMKRSQLYGGELLYTMAGTIGIATIFPTNTGEANINQAIAKIICKPDVNKEYLKTILNCSICKNQATRFLTTSAQPNINFEQIKTIKIPYPPHNIQKQIVQEVQKRTNQANKLKQETNETLETAKAKVEQIILGAA